MVAIGLRAQKGGAVIVGIAAGTDGPKLLFSRPLATAAEGDRLSLEPYLIASQLPRFEAEAAVAEGRKRQDQLAAEGLAEIVREHGPKRAALLVNRAGWVTDLLDYSREFPEHVPVAENLAVREALRFGIRRCGMDLTELDEKSLSERAEQVLGLSPAEIDAKLREFGAVAGKPWRKEQKLACLAAWVAVQSSL
jgi:hypothetical protein